MFPHLQLRTVVPFTSMLAVGGGTWLAGVCYANKAGQVCGVGQGANECCAGANECYAHKAVHLRVVNRSKKQTSQIK